MWSHLFGRGIVESNDDFRESNPPANAALLERPGQGLRRARLRPQARPADDPQQPHLPGRLSAERVQQGRREVLLALSAALLSARSNCSTRSARRPPCPSSSPPARRNEGDAIAGPGPRQARVPEDLRPAGAADGLRVRADERFEPGHGDSVFQRPADL